MKARRQSVGSMQSVRVYHIVCSACVCVCIYIYIYIYICTCTFTPFSGFEPHFVKI
jgi:hypothetical protein